MNYNEEKSKSNLLLEGVAAAPGITIGKAYYFDKKVFRAEKTTIENVDEAIEQFREALAKSKKELQKILDLALEKLGKDRAVIFEAQIMILDDPILIETIENRIRDEKLAPAYIVEDEISKYEKMMNASDDPYMQERAHDVHDIKNRIIRNIRKEKWKSKVPYDRIIVAESLTPSDTVLFSKRNAKAFVTDFGGLTSHTAILARSLNIPAVVGVHDASIEIKDDDTLIVDGFYGRVYVNPDEETLRKFEKKIEKLEELKEEFRTIIRSESETLDGKKIRVMGNLDVLEELKFMVENNADGIGLVRTEQLFADEGLLPDEEKQFEVYKTIAEACPNSEVVIRVFDVGGDKVLPVDVKESNPFLGWRGIRFLLDNKTHFKEQIRAILRASAFGRVKILLPMISALEEVKETIALIEQCKTELSGKNIPYDNEIKLGVMIEVPSAAALSDKLAKYVDFFSLGTNDLVQYLLAVDRTNEIVSELYQEFHPAVLHTISYVARHAKRYGVEVTICGEMAADTLAVPLLVGLGIPNVSVSAVSIPYVKRIIKNMTEKDAKSLANKCLQKDTHAEIVEELKIFVQTYGLNFEEKILGEE